MNKIKYEWNFDNVSVKGLPMSNTIFGQLPAVPWIVKTLGTLLHIVDNTNKYINLSFDDVNRNKIKEIHSRTERLKKEYELANQLGEIEDFSYTSSFDKFIKLVNEFSKFILTLPSAQNLTENLVGAEWGLERYNTLFQSIKLPDVANHVHDDDYFSYWRLAGNNPLLLELVESFPVNFPYTEEQYKSVMGNDRKLEHAIKNKEIYIVNYKGLGGIATRNNEEKKGYTYEPIALFSVSKDKKNLIPLAIQCDQDPKENAIFLPSKDSDYIWGWEMAKYIVQSADESHHEMFSHLALTHFISEAFSVATLRNFRETHPIYKLLITHFEGTIFINFGATVGLMLKDEFVDKLFASEINAINKEVLNNRFTFDFKERMLHKDIVNRGVDDRNALPDYPYRDDAILIWDAIHEWVKDYVGAYYWSIQEAKNDKELMAWFNDLIDNAKIKNFTIPASLEELVDTLTMVIFTASAQHAAVNFSQPDWMLYAPVMTAGVKGKKPQAVKGHTNSNWLNMIPDTNVALIKQTIYALLGGVQHGSLGSYIDPKNGEKSIFDEPRITVLLDKFRNKLENAESEISSKNINRFKEYTYLLPSRIPASTNI